MDNLNNQSWIPTQASDIASISETSVPAWADPVHDEAANAHAESPETIGEAHW